MPFAIQTACLRLLILTTVVLYLASSLLNATGLLVWFLPLCPRDLTQVVFFKENFTKSWPNTASILSKRSDLQQSKKEVLTIDSLFQMLFVILSRNTDMCLLKGDTTPLTLNLNALLIWDASWGSKTDSLWVVVGGRGVAGLIYEMCGKFWHPMLEPLFTCYRTHDWPF